MPPVHRSGWVRWRAGRVFWIFQLATRRRSGELEPEDGTVPGRGFNAYRAVMGSGKSLDGRQSETGPRFSLCRGRSDERLEDQRLRFGGNTRSRVRNFYSNGGSLDVSSDRHLADL